MKRMKKKVVAMVTLAMFVMTLLPMAAFAGTTEPAAADRSSISTTYDNVEVDVKEEVALKASVLDKDGNATDKLLDDVTVWVTDKAGNNVDSVVFKGSSGTPYPGVLKASLKDNEDITVTFAKPGEYTINATADVNGKDVALKQVANRQVVVVNSVDQDRVEFDSNVVFKEGADKYVGVVKPNIKFNGIDTMTITGNLINKKGQPILDQDITLSSNKSALVLKDETVTTGENGEFKIEFAMTDEVNAAITVNTGELEYTLKVLANADSAEEIKVIKDGGVVLATNDENWNSKADSKFIDAVQFEITDKNGNVLEGNQADKVFTADNDDKVMSITKPNASTLKPENLKLVWNEDKSAYTFAFADDLTDKALDGSKTLVAGDYTVKVALDNDATATASFKVAKFGDKEKLVVTPYAKFHNNGAAKYVEVKDQIRLGCDLGLKAEYVDANGLTIPANAVLGAEGEAIKEAYNANNGYTNFKLYESNPAYDSLIGTTITVKGYDKKEKLQAENVVLTVVKDYSEYELAFDPAEGYVNKDNTVNVSVVDKDGRVAKQLNGKVEAAWVVKQSNKDAKVTVDTKKTVTSGKGELTVYSTKATSADIVVRVKADNGAIYAGTLNYTFGEKDAYADTNVVMTINALEMVVNNEVVKLDAAPYVDKNWRTMVPLRAITEAFGVEPEWDNDKRTVTVEKDGVKVVMTIDKKTYTVNGEEKTMDTAPVINNSRTMVPVRFVAEELGFTVTPLYNSTNGTTESVVISK